MYKGFYDLLGKQKLSVKANNLRKMKIFEVSLKENVKFNAIYRFILIFELVQAFHECLTKVLLIILSLLKFKRNLS